uniref:H/ACA RNA-protein complex protein Gar1 n=1 Tax=Archaeoglobus fulgidus TaxID=2234 RepID=A0A7J2TIZ4_ARCFL
MKKLINLGKPEKTTKSGLLLLPLQPTNVPRIGEKVVTRKMEEVGIVVDIIGPVSSPYALIKPSKIVNEDLFVVGGYGGDRKGEGKGAGKGSRKGGRKKGD